MNMFLSQPSFFQSFQIQLRVIGALLMREVLTRFGRHNIGFMWMFVEPMLFTLGVATLWTFARVGHSKLPIIPFAVTGYSSVLLWRNMPNRCSGSIVPNLALMYHRNVRVIDIFSSRILLEFSGATLSFIILCSIFIFIGWMPVPEDVSKILIGWFMLTWFGASLALVIGAWSELSDIVEKVWHPITYLLFPLSGAMFMVDWLPDMARTVVLLLPMVHGVEILREGYFGSAVTAHYNIPYMASICLGLTLIGLILTDKVGKAIIPE